MQTQEKTSKKQSKELSQYYNKVFTENPQSDTGCGFFICNRLICDRQEFPPDGHGTLPSPPPPAEAGTPSGRGHYIPLVKDFDIMNLLYAKIKKPDNCLSGFFNKFYLFICIYIYFFSLASIFSSSAVSSAGRRSPNFL